VDARALVGTHFPGSYGDFVAWFSTDADCLDYLEWLRWPDGFVCPACGAAGVGYLLADGRFECRDCSKRCSVTAGTFFDRTRTALTVWLNTAWLFATQKDGISALALRRNLSLGSYQTAWAMLHRLRSVLTRPGRELLSGTVEVDETLIGGSAPGDRGGRTPGEKALVAVAVERVGPKGFGRCRMQVIPNASTDTLRGFLVDNVEEGATVVTDGWQPYRKAIRGLYTHERHVAPGPLAHDELPGVHRIASLVKRWLLSTHQGSVDDDHLPLYLNEYVFRFNRRRSRHRGMLFYRLLQLAVGHDPVRYRDLISTRRPETTPRPPPGTRGKPRSLEREREDRPWRKRRPAPTP
jgi:transposase-like protein